MILDEQLMSEFETIAVSVGCELADASFQGGLLKIVLDHPEGVTITHCQTVSKQVSAQLDVSDWGPGKYTLEVTSPGLDREMYRPHDYERFTGSQLRVTWHPPEGKRTDVGMLSRCVPSTENPDGIEAIEVEIGPEDTRHIPLQSIEVARLVPEL